MNYTANERKYIELEYKSVELGYVLVQVEWSYWYDPTIKSNDYEIEDVKVLEFDYRYEEDKNSNFTKEELAEFIYKELFDENSKIFKELMVE